MTRKDARPPRKADLFLDTGSSISALLLLVWTSLAAPATSAIGQSARDHVREGVTHQAHGRIEDAVVSFRKATELDSDDALAHHFLGTALEDLGQTDEAITAFRKAIELEPDLVLAHYRLGKALKKKGKLAEAIASFRKAIPYSAAPYALGMALREAGQEEEAQKRARKGLGPGRLPPVENPDPAKKIVKSLKQIRQLLRPS